MGRICCWVIMDTWYIRSGTAMSETRVVDLNREMNWFMASGRILRTACGMITHRNMRVPDSPVERAASTWPRGMDWMPARKVSVKYPLEARPRAMTAENI